MALLNKIGQVLTSDLTKDFKFPKNSKAVEHLEFTFVEKLKKFRGTYQLGKRVHYSQAYLTELIQEAVHSCSSAYNSQSARIIVLFTDSHHQFWNIVKDVQRQHVPASVYEGIRIKLDQCENAYGTILFYEDQNAIQQLQKKIPFSADDFPLWSEQTSGMVQFAAWTALADSGLGASLQHYNAQINHPVAEHFKIDENWLLRAQVCFGSIEEAIEDKIESVNPDSFQVFS